MIEILADPAMVRRILESMDQAEGRLSLRRNSPENLVYNTDPKK